MSIQPHEDSDEVYFVQPDVVPIEEDADAIEVMWMERNSRPFVPTPWKPMRALRCTGVTKNGPRAGKRCGREATLGTTICEAHGANLPSIKKAAENRKNQILLRLVGMTDDALETIDELRGSAVSEAVRLKAATEILDRAGVRGGSDLNVKVEQVDTAADLVRNKLEELRKRTIDGQVLEQKAQEALVQGVTVDQVDNSASPASGDEHPAEENTDG